MEDGAFGTIDKVFTQSLQRKQNPQKTKKLRS